MHCGALSRAIVTQQSSDSTLGSLQINAVYCHDGGTAGDFVHFTKLVNGNPCGSRNNFLLILQRFRVS